MISGFLHGYRSIRSLVTKLFERIWRFFKRALRNDETKKIAIEFCTEVAVLLAVFPWLDNVIASRSGSGASHQGEALSNWFVVVTFVVSGLFLLFAVIMGVGKE